MKRVAHRHTDWLSLVEPSGSFVTVPVLNRVFPNGVDRLDPSTRDEMRQHLPTDFHDTAVVTTWIEWVLRDLLRWGSGLRSGPAVPATLSNTVGEHATVLRPDYVLVDDSGADARTRVLVCVYPPRNHPDRAARGRPLVGEPGRAHRFVVPCNGRSGGARHQWR